MVHLVRYEESDGGKPHLGEEEEEEAEREQLQQAHVLPVISRVAQERTQNIFGIEKILDHGVKIIFKGLFGTNWRMFFEQLCP